MRPRLLALDIDGTLLDPFGKLAERVREAVAAAHRRGLQVVLCTGRRFRAALPMAQALGLDGAIVVHNGALVKDIATGRTELTHYLPADLCRGVLALVRELSPPMVYVDAYHEQTDILTEADARAHGVQTAYLADNAPYTRYVEDLTALPHDNVILMSLMGSGAPLAALAGRARDAFGDRVLTHLLMNKVYREHILEFLAPGAGKWPALVRLAERRGIAPAEIAAVGDDENDVEMIREAGLGIAMGNAVDAARAAARITVRSNAEGGALEAIEQVLLRA